MRRSGRMGGDWSLREEMPRAFPTRKTHRSRGTTIYQSASCDSHRCLDDRSLVHNKQLR